MIRRILVLAAILCLGAAATAAADAPDPIPSATTGTAVQNGDGSFTLTVSGKWQWTTHHSDCNKDRAGVGYAIDWHDSADAGNLVSKNGITANVGTTDAPGTPGINAHDGNLVHPAMPGNDPGFGPTVTYDGGTPTKNDAQNWISSCGTFNGTYNTGTWGPISHTYPASHTSEFVICPIMYDPHQGPSGTPVGDPGQIIAGGKDHNGDNSIETNGDTPLGNGCFTSSFKPPTPPPPAPPQPTPGIKVVKEQRFDNSTAPYTTDVLTGMAGQKVDYEMIVTNTGNQPLTLTISDPHCDPGTLTGPFGGISSNGTLPPGQQTVYFCSHVLVASDAPAFTNTVIVNGVPASGTTVLGSASVVTNVAQGGAKAVKHKKAKKKRHRRHRHFTPHFTG